MIRYYKRAIQDILDNFFLNAVTIITIALSILIVSAFALFFVNASEIMNSWKEGLRIMVYLNPDLPESAVADLKNKIQGMYGIQRVNFISKTEAMALLKEKMKRQSSLLSNLEQNPLPDAFEVRMIAASQNREKIETLATRLEALSQVDEVEYGQSWLGRFTNIFNLFRLAGYALGGLFFMASVFIVANTTRLVLYSRREEVEIMRLVGAEESFIKAPFYIQGIIQGALGAAIGLAVLFILFLFVSSNMAQDFSYGLINIRFFSPGIFSIILLCSMVVGWLGAFLSLKQFSNV
ncbi:MAG: ABC transporter permease [Deltaproteobacteria bacterium]|nr:ABC transporter permease [Deltaproteobacteria bacterium]